GPSTKASTPISSKRKQAHSTLFNALNISLPILRPTGNLTPGALNFNQDYIKLIAPTNPTQIKQIPIIKESPIMKIFYIKYTIKLRNFQYFLCQTISFERHKPPFVP